jgi:CRP-like cAMP-binding protein
MPWRCAWERLSIACQLCLLLARDRADGRREVTIPGLKDMATGLTVETVSRAMSQLRKSPSRGVSG